MRPHSIRLNLSLVVLMLPLLACNYLFTVPDDNPDSNPPNITPFVIFVTGEDFEAVVFSAEAAAANRYGDYTVFPNPTGYWTPSEADIQSLEAHLEAFLDEHADAFYQRQPPAETWLPDYGRQYYGFTKDGEQYIYGNYLCDISLLESHPNEIVMVEDGGDCFFQLHYNPATQEFSNLSVNGFA